MVLIQDRILKIDIYNFEMSYKTPEKSLKSDQIYSDGCSVVSMSSGDEIFLIFSPNIFKSLD